MNKALVEELVSTIQDARKVIQDKMDSLWSGSLQNRGVMVQREYLEQIDAQLMERIDYLESNIPEE